jgi:hypothetical protein
MNVGTIDAGVVGAPTMGIKSDQGIARMTDAAIANGGAFLVSELEKRDNQVREPLSSITYARDIPVKTGGGWVEFISSLNIDYGSTGGSGDANVLAAGANSPTVVQAKLDRDIYKTHVYSSVLRIQFIDLQRQAITGRSLDRMLQTGIRLNYDKHMEANVYTGVSQYDQTGLLNDPDITTSNVPNGAAGSTEWSTKTPDEILLDINTAIEKTWEASFYDTNALPNHILLPYAQYNYLATTRLSELGEKSILSYINENNLTKNHGGNLVIAATAWNKGAGVGDTDRMVVYQNSDRYLAVEELVPLSRTMTQANTGSLSFDSVYMSNLSQVEIFAPTTISYWDLI